jgi:hypothetical protein
LKLIGQQKQIFEMQQQMLSQFGGRQKEDFEEI